MYFAIAIQICEVEIITPCSNPKIRNSVGSYVHDPKRNDYPQTVLKFQRILIREAGFRSQKESDSIFHSTSTHPAAGTTNPTQKNTRIIGVPCLDTTKLI